MNNEFRILIDSLRTAMSKEDRRPIERSVNVVLDKYTKNWNENTYSSQNLKKLYYKGLNPNVAQTIKDAEIDADSFRRYVDDFDDVDKDAMALKLQTINKDEQEVEINAVSYFCTNLLNRLVEEAITGQQKRPTKSGPNGYLKKLFLMIHFHQCLPK